MLLGGSEGPSEYPWPRVCGARPTDCSPAGQLPPTLVRPSRFLLSTAQENWADEKEKFFVYMLQYRTGILKTIHWNTTSLGLQQMLFFFVIVY